jgi:nucleotide sugar dehydrogenase
MKIGIIGMGVVGSAIYQGLQMYASHQVFTYDIKHSNTKITDVLDTNCIFICVPTNPTVDSHCDISIVESTLQLLSDSNYKGVVVIKSTLIPGTTELLIQKFKLKIAFVPEFLRQDYAFPDFVSKENALIVGTHSDLDYQLICDIHKNIVELTKKVTPTEAELTKYFCNNFNSVRIVFANIFYEVSTRLGADYSKVLDAVKSGPLYTYGDYLKCNENLRGFAGACLPKDIKAFTALLKDLDLPYKLLQSTIDDNNDHFNK